MLPVLKGYWSWEPGGAPFPAPGIPGAALPSPPHHPGVFLSDSEKASELAPKALWVKAGLRNRTLPADSVTDEVGGDWTRAPAEIGCRSFATGREATGRPQAPFKWHSTPEPTARTCDSLCNLPTEKIAT